MAPNDNKPLDWHISNRTGRVRLARLFSNVVSPPMMGAVLGLVVSLYTLPLYSALFWAAVYGLLVSLTPILFVVYWLHTGRIQELHMSDTKERHLPYLVGITCSFIMFSLVRFFALPDLVGCLSIFNALQLIGLGIINVYWLISFHSSAMTATVLICTFVFGSWTLAITLPLWGMVSGVRLYLKRHTLTQLIAGIFLGASIVLILTQFNCFR